MPTTWAVTRPAALVATGMVLLFVGVVAGSYTGTILRAEYEPMLVGRDNVARNSSTGLSSTTAGGGVLEVKQVGSGTGIRADSVRGNAGIFAAAASDRSAVLAESNAGHAGRGAAVTADGNRNTGVHATSDGGIGTWTSGGAAALYATGQTVVDGDLTVTGGCTGCALTVVAVNASNAVLLPGSAVTIAGATQGSMGEMFMTVVPAATGDPVIGIVENVVVAKTVGGSEGTTIHVAGDDAKVLPGETMRLRVNGVVSAATVDPHSPPIAAGDSLMAGASGTLRGTTEADIGPTIGYALGPSSGGVVALFISPH